MDIRLQRLLISGVLIVVFFNPGIADAQEPVIPVWPDVAPGSEDWTQQEISYRDARGWDLVRNVVRPTLTVYLPDRAKATGTAVIVAPGGGFLALAWGHEGVQVAQWLRDQGVAAFVLKYRLMNTGATEEESREKAAASDAALEKVRSEAGARNIRDVLRQDPERAKVIPLAIADGKQALKLVRERASDWGIAPDRIGIMGFSAGGAVAMGVVMEHDAASRPNFAAPIYSANLSDAPIPADAPPLFLCAASDDWLAAESLKLYSDWKTAGGSAELHVYSKGGHGFGMLTQGLPVDNWVGRFRDWLQVQGLLSTAPGGAAALSDNEVTMTGTWQLKVDSTLGSGSPTLSLKQEGEKVTGQYQGALGEAPVIGTLYGNQSKFSFTVDVGGQKVTVSCSGTVEGDSITGQVEYGEEGQLGTGTFTGKLRAADEQDVRGTTESKTDAKRSLIDILTPEIRACAPAQVAELIQQVDVRRDIEFADTPEKKLLLDVYSPKGRGEEALPCVVWIHGGGLNSLTKDYDLIRWCAAYTARAGFVSFSIDYRLRREAELPAAIIDAKTAIRYVRAHAKEFGVDPDRIAVAGESAGGYLAAFVAFAAGASEFRSANEAETREDVSCAVIWYTPVWTELGFHPLDHISKEDPPSLFIHGEQDSLVNPADSRTFVDRCHSVGVKADLLYIQDAEHGFFDINKNVGAYKKHMTDALDATVAFLKKNLD